MKLRLAFLFGRMIVGSRPLDFAHIDDSPRGLTGTDGSFLGYASAMAGRGHDVTIFCAKQREVTQWGGCVVRPYEDRRQVTGAWDAALSWCDIVGLLDVSPRTLRVVDVQLNNFEYSKREHHDAVDLYLAPSESLARRLQADKLCGKAPWRVAPNGCDPGAYTLSAKVPGRCIYASSPDRGLHLVLEQWDRILAAVPEAHLRVFYHALPQWFLEIEANETGPHWSHREHARRARIVRELMGRHKGTVTYVGSVSRAQMALEYSEAMVLAGPADTVSRGAEGYTEGFGVAVLEGLAAGAIPCISDVDAFGEVYAGVAPMVHAPPTERRFADDEPGGRERAREWSDNVIRALTDPGWRDEWAAKGLAFAEKHAWPVLAEKLEATLLEAKARKAAA